MSCHLFKSIPGKVEGFKSKKVEEVNLSCILHFFCFSLCRRSTMGNTFGGGGGAVANGADALVAAALVKDHVKVKELLAAEGVDPAAQDAQGNHGLGAACCSGSGECVAALLAASQRAEYTQHTPRTRVYVRSLRRLCTD